MLLNAQLLRPITSCVAPRSSASRCVPRAQVATEVGASFRLPIEALCVRPLRFVRSAQADTTKQNGNTTRRLTADDKLTIIDLCHRFDHLINQQNQEALGPLFAADGVVHSPKGTITGATNVVSYFKSMSLLSKGNRHLTCNIVVDPVAEAGKARASSYRLLHRACMPPVLLASGTIEDELVWVDGGWKFSARTFAMDPAAGTPL